MSPLAPPARPHDALGEEDLWDVVIVGGGAAGLNAALVLAQARRAVLVVDRGEPRNRFSGHMHGYLSRDGLDPAELLRLGREEVERFGGTIVRARAVDARVLEPGARFEVTLDEGGAVRARRLLVAAGLRDVLPEVEGLADLWGDTVFHCPYCAGCEVGGTRVAVLAVGPESVDEAHLMLQYTDDVVLLTDGALDVPPARRRGLEARGIQVVDGKVTACCTDGDGRLVAVAHADGRQSATSAVVKCEGLMLT